MITIICDNCNEVMKEPITDLLEFFNGSIQLSSVDLCQGCWNHLQETLNRWVK